MLVHTPGSKVVGSDDEGNKYYENMSKQIGKRAGYFDPASAFVKGPALQCLFPWPLWETLSLFSRL